MSWSETGSAWRNRLICLFTCRHHTLVKIIEWIPKDISDTIRSGAIHYVQIRGWPLLPIDSVLWSIRFSNGNKFPKSCIFGFGLKVLMVSKIISPLVYYDNRFLSACVQYLDWTLGKFFPIYGPGLLQQDSYMMYEGLLQNMKIEYLWEWEYSCNNHSYLS